MKLNYFSNAILNVVLGAIICFSFIKVIQNDYITYMANDFSDESTIFFQVKDVNLFDFEKICDNGEQLQAKFNSNTFAIYYNSTYTVPMLYGDFFVNKKENFRNIVLGKNYKNLIEYVDNEPFFKFNNELFYVCGIIGFEYSTPVDKNMYFFLPEVKDWASPSIIYSINNAKSFNFDENITKYDNVTVGVGSLLKLNIFNYMLFILIGCLVFIIYYQISYSCYLNQPLIFAMRLIGYKIHNVSLEITKIYFTRYFLWILVGEVLSYITFCKAFYQTKTLYIFSYTLIALILVYLIILIILKKACR